MNYNTGRMNWKFGGDFLQGWIYNYYPAMFGGEYLLHQCQGQSVVLYARQVWRCR